MAACGLVVLLGLGLDAFGVFAGDADELLEVLHPALVLRVEALLQLGQQAGALQDRLEHLLGRGGRGSSAGRRGAARSR